MYVINANDVGLRNFLKCLRQPDSLKVVLFTDTTGDHKTIMKLMKKNEIDEKQSKVVTKGLTRNEMTGQTFIFFLAGYETTATTLTWALYELCRDIGEIFKNSELGK